MTGGVADEVMARLVPAFEGARDPGRAVGAAAYMRGQFPFLGIASPERRALQRRVLAGLRPAGEDDLRRVALACWELPEREYQYFACDWLRIHAAVAGPGFLPAARLLITTRAWWDTVDPLAARVVGDLAGRHAEWRSAMDAWAGDEDRWLVRTAILHQLHFGADTDTGRLFGYCTRQAAHPDFFVRKAIGWALRGHARTDPAAVRAYLDAHRDVLSPLSVREAAKHLGQP